ncbi:HpsJ family protein [Kamptonema sp. UHCC 0994]|uniref:hormogonium polysaccharide biosynthesis protein HpsJ n=1 Tax=Kamptonema sp. UHCC 0994 TaxID=3031329 RepID=UPI0023B8B009|nr:HpsJ family protein [Kamptonema sp. UHCC 0994]MDF0553520.1 HpsJ family protein [Kamptonema sp. UHCC 0994]
MKATNSRQFSSMAARTLKVVGIILILSAVFDCIILSLPGESSDFFTRGWQMALTTQVVDRGILPMTGIALLFTGFWVDSNSGVVQEPRNIGLDLRFWAILFSSLVGLFYLLVVPVHLNNTRLEVTESLAQIDREATAAENQLNAQLSSDQFKTQVEQLKSQRRSQITSVLSDEQKLKEVLQNPQTPPELKKLLQEAKSNPKALETFLDQQAQSLPTQAIKEITTRKQQKEKEIRMRSRNSSLQTGISSLLLAIGYITIGWTGLRSMGILRAGRRKA